MKTFERLDNTKGYVEGNVVAVIKGVNLLKNVMTEDPAGLRLTKKQVELFLKRAFK